jgi:peptidoglycan hydrolase-like protein with peptidoglycan-binding domain
MVGHLDPHTEMSGAAQRLKQLGYYRGSLPVDDEHPGVTRALRAFQENEGLQVTGTLTEETAGRLNQRFGR